MSRATAAHYARALSFRHAKATLSIASSRVERAR